MPSYFRILAAMLAAAATVKAADADFVICISVDGLRGDLLQALIDNDVNGDFAGFERFVLEGATTFNARTDFTHTNTLPNHTSMITGRPVLQPTGQPDTVHHGYTTNGFPSPSATLHNQGNPNVSYIASVFDVAHDHGLSTSLYASKSKFIIYEQSYDATNGAADVVGFDDGSDKIDMYVEAATGSPANASNMHAAFMADMAADRFDFSFVHYRDPDSAGHNSGWGSDTWNTSVANVSGYLIDIFALVESDPVLAGRTAIVLTADHGGIGTGHSNNLAAENYVIPFLVWGPGVTAGSDLYVLNPMTRADPAADRPDYNEPIPPIRNGDACNLSLSLLGLPAIPGSTINQDHSLTAAFPPVVPTTTEWGLAAMAVLQLIFVTLHFRRRAKAVA